MHAVDLVISASWLLPIAPVNVALENHAIAIDGGRIVAVGPTAQIEAEFQPAERIHRPHHVLMPGLVNAHTRAAMTLFRGLPVYSPAMRWRQETAAPTEQNVTPDLVRDGTQIAIAEMLRAGITTFADSYFFPEESAKAAAEARIRAVIGLPVSESASHWAPNSSAHFDQAARLWDEYKTSPWVSLYFAPPAAYEIGDNMLTRLRRVADELDARIAMPVHETETEVRDGVSQHGARPLQRLATLGLLRPGFTAVHMNLPSEEDLAIAQSTGISVIACPQSNLRLGSGSCPAAELLQRNVTLALGTDSPVTSGAFDMLAEARLAALLTGISAADALAAATLGGAVALGLGTTCGSLEPGKAADLISIDLDSLACQSAAPKVETMAETVLFNATRRDVCDVWTGGRAAVRDQQLMICDEQELRARAREWIDRLRGPSA